MKKKIEDQMELRQKAERLLDPAKVAAEEIAGMSSQDIGRLVHELRVHQIELKMQNDELRRIQAELEKARDRYLHLYDFAPTAYLTVNDKGAIVAANLTAATSLGSERGSLAGQLFSRFIPREDQDTWYFHRKHILETGEFQSFPLRLVGNSGSEFYANLECMRVKDDDSELPQIRIAAVDITELKRTEEVLRQLNETLEKRVAERSKLAEARAKQLQVLMSELTFAEQRERQRIAEILHDNLQQLLVAAKINSEVLSARIGAEEKLHVESIIDLLCQSIQTSRSLTTDLFPPVLRQNRLSPALEWLARWMQENQGFTADLQVDPNYDPAREDITLLLFQSVRELLFNVVKHAGVKSARITMSRDQEGGLRVAVIDQGRGMDLSTIWEKAKTGSGFGLFSIRERLELIGGSLEIESSPGNGAFFSLVVPLETIKDKDEKRIRKIIAQGQNAKASGNKIRVLLADDHTIVRQGLSTLLNLYPDIETVGEAAHGEEVVEKARKLQPDVILMDISMPKMGGLEATRIIASEFPHIRIICLSMHDKEDHATRLMEAGASGYCTKGCAADVLLSAIRGGEATKIK